MIHKIKIYNRGQLHRQFEGIDIDKLSFKASAKLLGMYSTYLQIYVDDEYLNFSSSDVTVIGNEMKKIMYKNEKTMDFEIEGLFDI